jgi:serine/threonine protein kinase
MSHVFDTDELIGTQVGRYRIDARIARGGMGVLYRAEHTGLARIAALKVIAPELAKDRDYRLRFEREARTAAAIEHPNVVPVWDFAEDRGLLYIAMRYVDGPDVGDIVARERRLAPQRAAGFVAQAGAALDAAHARGLVHRDVKPANMLVERRGGGEHVWVADFGLARASARSRTDLTRHGAIMGTLDFIAPEQLDDRPIDGRADVYALGCVLFYALCGRVPYPRKNDAERMRAHALEPPPVLPLPELRAFDAVIAKAMAKRPEDRFQHAGELGVAALDVARRAPSQHRPPSQSHPPEPRPQTPVPAPQTPPPPPVTPAPRPRSFPGWAIPVVASLAALVVALGVLAATGAFGGGGDPGTGDTGSDTGQTDSGAVTEDEAGSLMDQFESAFNDHSTEPILALMGPDPTWHTPGFVDATTPADMEREFNGWFTNSPGISVEWDKAGALSSEGAESTMKVDMRLYEDGAQTGHWTPTVTFARVEGEPRITALVDE